MIGDTFRVHDLNEIIIARKIINKCDISIRAELQSIQFDLSDLYESHGLELIEQQINIVVTKRDSLNEILNMTLSKLTNEKFTASSYEVELIDYYNDLIYRRLERLKDGRGYSGIGDFGKTKMIESFKIDKTGKLYKFKVDVILNNMLKAYKEYTNEIYEINNKLIEYGKNIQGDAPSFEKQAERFIMQAKKQMSLLGQRCAKISMDGWSRRMTTFLDEENDILLHPLSMNNFNKSMLPILLEVNGLLDINDLCLINRVDSIESANVQYNISIPCIKNIFDAENEFIDVNTRRSLSESQIVILERIYEELSNALIFIGKPNLKKSFVELIIWLMKKVTLCLEEETFLRNRAFEYINNEKETTYSQMEDLFFLPFIYERLCDSFNSERIQKKPEKSKGEIDLLFDNIIPLELKVWKDKEKKTIAEESAKYRKNISQTACYANINRLGFLVILDVSNKNGETTNLEKCWHVEMINAGDDELYNTKVVSCIFNCNYISPSQMR
ncbi:hypothetical protein R2R35_06230 [Anaerocolumna sp. AGMB13020]|uniref:hypothetical protein n=1 Tax=Anaerocolumna sp. AGMB13020 TaxID=3081750 RepID=UPI002952A113|nr:hypothetical protein [Anaerocolumna sp. AGMB13020]WOO38096.1 hypothetical protein R2R35_06230 [Anaerocolumna sp. AGMB13020]